MRREDQQKMSKESSMQTLDTDVKIIGKVDDTFSKDERVEMSLMGLLDAEGRILQRSRGEPQVPRKPMTSLNILNEAYDYELPSSFSRGLSVSIKHGQRILWISGTASIDDRGETIYVGDFRAQLWRTFRNITELLTAEGATWHDIVRTSCYLRDIERDYDEFNKVRTLFFECMALDPVPASTGIQARLCRSDLLIEIEGFAVVLDEEEK
jgi:enamine deaminase RidA (YjgF/YER057c/UK114 family)